MHFGLLFVSVNDRFRPSSSPLDCPSRGKSLKPAAGAEALAKSKL